MWDCCLAVKLRMRLNQWVGHKYGEESVSEGDICLVFLQVWICCQGVKRNKLKSIVRPYIEDSMTHTTLCSL